VRRTQKTPFSTARVSCYGRLRPSARRLGRNNGSRTAHWASVRSMFSVYAVCHKFQPLSGLKVFMRNFYFNLAKTILPAHWE
jgi:predicted NAD-dependent protein-ADP-ribosyltransferase YbiA (DUF1768 family)